MVREMYTTSPYHTYIINWFPFQFNLIFIIIRYLFIYSIDCCYTGAFNFLFSSIVLFCIFQFALLPHCRMSRKKKYFRGRYSKKNLYVRELKFINICRTLYGCKWRQTQMLVLFSFWFSFSVLIFFLRFAFKACEKKQ